jgi:thioredoxin 1
MTDADFTSTLYSQHRPVLVYFSASWCPSCKAMKPSVQSFTRSSPNVALVQVDIDASPEIASRYKVQAVPTVILFKRGQAVLSRPGVLSGAELDALLRPYLF